MILGQPQALHPAGVVDDPVLMALRTLVEMLHGERPWTRSQYAAAERVVARVVARRRMTPADFNELYSGVRPSFWSPAKL